MSRQANQLIKKCLETQDTYLDLGNCGLNDENTASGTEFDQLLGQCTHLETLILSSEWYDWDMENGFTAKESANKGNPNRFAAHPSALEQLAGLKKLVCAGHHNNKWGITNMGFVQHLHQLQTLNLGYNQITELKGLKQLYNLQRLSISDNKITELKGLEQLSNLQKLFIADNQITELKGLEQLNNLQQLDIAHNQISSISYLFPFVKRNEYPLKIVAKESWRTGYGEINVGGNPLTTPPMEVVEQGHDAVIRYLEKLQTEGREQVYEAKLVLTGSGESGKTSLSWRLNNKTCTLPQKDDRTKEVEVSDYVFKTAASKDFTAHVWDFGGQQIIHNFHRLFMNDSALYILITETSRENDDFDYWLQTIQLFGGDSPILFVQNKRNAVPRRLGITHYKKYFNIKDDLYEVNLLNNEGLPELEQAIQKYIQQLPIVQRTIPKSWFNLRRQLEQINKPYISYNEFLAACNECNIHEPVDIDDAGGFLHLLGVILWYKDNTGLRDKIILERHWATKALFQLVFHENINKQQAGRFTKTDAQAIWDADKETDYKHHTAQLIALMQEFKLAYRRRNKKDAFIIPALLPAIMPAKTFAGNSRITVVYEYVHIPRGIVNQLTAELYEKIESDENTWSEGVWLKEGNTEARVMENRNERKIIIEIAGMQHRELFGMIKKALDDIHSEYKGIKYEMKIPCICDSCKTGTEKHFYNYQTIISRMEEGKKTTIECEKSTDDVSLHALLDNILPASAINELSEFMSSVEFHFSRVHQANKKTHSDLGMIKEELSLQNEMIIGLVILNRESQKLLQQLLEKVDHAFDAQKANDVLQQMETEIAEQLTAFPKQIAAEWKKLSTKSDDGVDVKAKLKFKLPIIPFLLEYEGELAVDMKKLGRKLRGLVF